MTEREMTVALLAVMAEQYCRTMTPAALEMMVDDLSDLSYEQIREATRVHRRGPRAAFWPQPGEILAAHRGDSDAQAALALSRCGNRSYGGDAITNRCIIALGGEHQCRNMDTGIWTTQFRRFYAALHAAGLGPELARTSGFLNEREAVSANIGRRHEALPDLSEEAARRICSPAPQLNAPPETPQNAQKNR